MGEKTGEEVGEVGRWAVGRWAKSKEVGQEIGGQIM